MQTKRLMLSLGLAIGSGLAAQGAVFAQEYRGTEQQQMACTPDVWRLCSSQIPDVNRIVACLRANTQNSVGRLPRGVCRPASGAARPCRAEAARAPCTAAVLR